MGTTSTRASGPISSLEVCARQRSPAALSEQRAVRYVRCGAVEVATHEAVRL